jgi:hypothetical protein
LGNKVENAPKINITKKAKKKLISLSLTHDANPLLCYPHILLHNPTQIFEHVSM